MSTKKMGRPTMAVKTERLQIRIDKSIMEDLDFCVEALQKNRSEIVREGIQLVKATINKK
jgi:metal-responsive CopG/Arc/MetJ family transcriptional regulator